MKNYKRFLIIMLFAAAAMLAFTACGGGGGGGGDSDGDTDVTFISAEQTGGASETADSTALTLTFDIDPSTLTADDITLTGATKGALSGSGTTRSIAISGITVANGAEVSVTITSPSGYSISGSPKTATVYRLCAWHNVGAAGFSEGWANSTSLYVYDGTPYVAYSDGGNDSKATVMKFNGAAWEAVDAAGFSAGEAYNTSLYVYDGTPYVAYMDLANGQKATVMKFNGAAWEAVGAAGFSAGEAWNTSLYI